jgi:PAT family beta-lactamase induction signal transducer AmpG
MTSPSSKLPPIWLLGLANAPLGLAGGVALLTVPQILAARHVPEPVIAQLTTLALVPTFAAFLLGPLLDVRFSRRTYAIVATVLAAIGTGAAFMVAGNIVLLGVALVCAMGGAAVNGIAVGGWFGSLIAKKDDATLGAWLTVANIGGFGLMAMTAIQVVRLVPPPVAAILLGAPVLAPLVLYAFTPAPGPDQRLASESFARFFRDLAAVLRRPVVVQLLLLFGVPAASFALTNTLGGLGRDYHASEAFVGLVGGAAATLAGLAGSLLVPLLARRVAGQVLYIGIGAIGCLFTASLTVLPHTPLVFALAMIGQNLAQSAALAACYALALQSLGEDNPFAATQFGLLACMSALPITYMQLVDGHAYGAGGLNAMYLADSGLGLLACAAMAIILVRLRGKAPQGDMAEPAAV